MLYRKQTGSFLPAEGRLPAAAQEKKKYGQLIAEVET